MKYKFSFDDYEARVLHSLAYYYLDVYKDEDVIYSHWGTLYSLKDASTVIRSVFNKKA